jgi:magnesium-transporting ATPase (P-type)
VAGDIIVIGDGDTIPADARVIHSTALQTAEAALTGQSMPVSKDAPVVDSEVALGDRHNMVFSGMAATYGCDYFSFSMCLMRARTSAARSTAFFTIHGFGAQ